MSNISRVCLQKSSSSYPCRQSRSAWVGCASQTVCSKHNSTRWMAIANGTCVSFCNQLWPPLGIYAPGTIAVNVTWMERGINDCQRHCSMYPSIFNRLRAMTRYWSEIETFPTRLHLTPPLGVFPLEFREKVWSSEN